MDQDQSKASEVVTGVARRPPRRHMSSFFEVSRASCPAPLDYDSHCIAAEVVQILGAVASSSRGRPSESSINAASTRTVTFSCSRCASASSTTVFTWSFSFVTVTMRVDKQAVFDSLRDQELRIPDLRPMFEHWPQSRNIHYQGLIPIVDRKLEGYVD